MTFESGTTIGAYRVLAKLGEGGMGEVYRARDTRLGRDVALKVLPDSFAADPERVARFEREAQILAALSHPNIAAIHGLEISGSTRVLVMQLVDGESLEARLRRGPLPLDDAIAIARQIGEALSAAHERGIVHRDLKPGNIMVTPDGGVKVLDFGLARMVEPDAAASGLSMSPTLSIQATMAGTILGTAPYMSPEQARGRAVDKRTDVWAFGCVLYEMLTGKRAFDGDDLTETVATIVKGDADWAALEAVAPTHVVAIVRGCLKKDPKQRYADIAVPLHLLESRVAAATAETPPPVPGLRRRQAWFLAAAALLVGALGMAAAMWLTRPAPTVAPPVRFVISLPEGFRTTGGGRQEIALSPDGRRLVFVANQRLYLRDLDDIEPHVIRGTDIFTSNLTNPVFSPDGREVAFWVADDSSLKRVPATGGTPITIAPTGNPFGLRWEPAGLVFGQGLVPGSATARASQAGVDLQMQGILRVASSGGSPEVLIPIKADEVATAGDSLPGGRGRLYWTKRRADAWDSGTVMVRTPAGEDKVLVRGASDGRYDGAGHLLYAKAGTVLAVPFDLERLTVTGAPVPAIEGVIHPLTSSFSGTAQYSLSVDGMLVYQPGPAQGSDERGAFRLAIFDGKDGVEPLDVPRGIYGGLRVSPDGNTVAYDDVVNQQGNIWVQPRDLKTAARRLTFEGTKNGAPVWSPDGQWVAFSSNRQGEDDRIFKQRVDGTGVAEPLTKSEKGANFLPMSWSPDGRFLLIASRKEGRYDLLVLSLKDGQLSPFGGATGSLFGTHATFSPDGRWVVYQRSGGSAVDIQVFVEPFPATGAKYLVPVKQAGHPFWSRDGQHLYFNQLAGTSVQVDVQATPSITFSPARPLSRVGRYEPNPISQVRNVDALPDGRLLGVIVGDGTARVEYQVVLNWLPALTAKLAR